MLRLMQSVITAIRLYLMRRRQFDNLKLRAYFHQRHDIDVGLYSYGCFDRWRLPGPLRIGRYCSFANTVRAAERNHPIHSLTTHPVLYDRAMGVVDEDLSPPSPLIVEDDVWVGHYVMILPGCKHIGRGAIIGAGSIVTHDVEAYTVVAGNPARKLRDRFSPDLVAAIESSRWWELDLPALRALVQTRSEMVHRPTAETIAAWLNERPR